MFLIREKYLRILKIYNIFEVEKKCLREIEKMVEKYKLRLNRKTKIINVSKEGLDFLGFRFCIYNKVILKVRRDTKKGLKGR